MRPKPPNPAVTDDLFRHQLSNLLDQRHELQRLGVQVPSDLSVIGIDDHEFAEMFSLTTLRQVPREQGRVAVELLLDHIADPDRPQSVIRMKAKLVVRNSTSALDPLQSAVVVDSRQERGDR